MWGCLLLISIIILFTISFKTPSHLLFFYSLVVGQVELFMYFIILVFVLQAPSSPIKLFFFFIAISQVFGSSFGWCYIIIGDGWIYHTLQF
ncbi:hypothetical protein CROQUDRAFT_586678 [Cronartium quercuum f. sp. fusiforme G11]|uniref:Uncharacterized protein n=1 Tax=Cronartium quercuum f. sp. fusiforme G11 TaxID=708437 RepID=A0A9P6TAE5_9BASI|nr:hypothetical protein CROQUDRAFT_586678 [Cronartium quercuum f. sp. fusiforme G11]